MIASVALRTMTISRGSLAPRKLGDLGARALVGRGGLLADLVDAAMDVGAVAVHVADHRVGDDARLEAGRGAVEIRQPAAAELAVEDREVGAQRDRVERSDDGHLQLRSSSCVLRGCG